jgi:hypothetical protein
MYAVDIEDLDLLMGPNGFECRLGEPEDRTWYRDASDVIDELNRLSDLCWSNGICPVCGSKADCYNSNAYCTNCNTQWKP